VSTFANPDLSQPSNAWIIILLLVGPAWRAARADAGMQVLVAVSTLAGVVLGRWWDEADAKRRIRAVLFVLKLKRMAESRSARRALREWRRLAESPAALAASVQATKPSPAPAGAAPARAKTDSTWSRARRALALHHLLTTNLWLYDPFLSRANRSLMCGAVVLGNMFTCALFWVRARFRLGCARHSRL
jgi:hypothetical protein